MKMATVRVRPIPRPRRIPTIQPGQARRKKARENSTKKGGASQAEAAAAATLLGGWSTRATRGFTSESHARARRIRRPPTNSRSLHRNDTDRKREYRHQAKAKAEAAQKKGGSPAFRAPLEHMRLGPRSPSVQMGRHRGRRRRSTCQDCATAEAMTPVCGKISSLDLCIGRSICRRKSSACIPCHPSSKFVQPYRPFRILACVLQPFCPPWPGFIGFLCLSSDGHIDSLDHRSQRLCRPSVPSYHFL